MTRQAGTRRLALPLLAAWVTACALAGQPATRTDVQLGPMPNAIGAPAVPPDTIVPVDSVLPELPMSHVEAPAAGGRRIEVLQASNDDLRMILRSLARQYGLGYQIDPSVHGRVTTHLEHVTLDDALDALVRSQGYDYSIRNNVLRVGPVQMQSRIFEMDFIALSRVGTGATVVQRRLAQQGVNGTLSQTAGAQTAATGLTGADVVATVEVTDLWEDLRVAVEGLLFGNVEQRQSQQVAGATGALGLTGGRAPGPYSRSDSVGHRLILNPSAGTVLVSGTPSQLRDIKTYLDTFQSAIQRQVRIEAKFVEVTLSRQYQLGIDWQAIQSLTKLQLNTGTGSGVKLSFGDPGGQTVTITDVLDALETQGDVRVLSSPSVSTLNNQRAVFNVTTDEVFFALTRQPVATPSGVIFTTNVETQPVAVGIVMDVVPQISRDNTITMNVRPMVTSLVRTETLNEAGVQAQAPVVDRRDLDTMVRVRDGETIVIGGLIQRRIEKNRIGVPLLKDIPLLKYLFSTVKETEQRGELVIFLTPTIVAGPAPVG